MKENTRLEEMSNVTGMESPEGYKHPAAEGRKGSLSRVIVFVGAAIVLLVGGWFLFRMTKKEDAKVAKGGDRVVPVTVAKAGTAVVPIEIHSIGNVLPYSTVNVIPQVSGQLSKVTFTQGQYVKKGQLLFEIDPRPYQAALAQAKGNVARDQAQVEQAKANLNKDIAQVAQLSANKDRDTALAKYAVVEVGRYETLVKQGAVSHEQSDQVNTNLATAQATIDADQKAIENAQAVVDADKAAIMTAKGTLEADQAAADNAGIMLGWTQIRSPIDGRTSSLDVYQGNIVTANSNQPLVSIAQVQPIYVNFTVPEQNLDVVRKHLQDGSVMVSAYIEGLKADSVNGNVSFLESTVNTTTGTVVLRAAFPNKDLRLFPGQFVDVKVSMPAEGPTVVVPSQALQTTQQGTAVWVIPEGEDTVTFDPVTVLRTQKGLTAIGSGVKSGDVVVTDGQLQLVPNAKVKIVQDKSTINDVTATPGD